MSDKKETKTIRMKVNIQELMSAAARECKDFSITLGFSHAIKSLQIIAKRAIETNDTVILDELENLCIIEYKEKEEEKKE